MIYINTLDSAFALFEYYFFELLLILPYLLLIIGFIIVFLFVFKKK